MSAHTGHNGCHAVPRFAVRYAEDFALLASLGLRHHRLTIDWARVEPEPGRHDPLAVSHYRDVLTAALEAGARPWVCLHHVQFGIMDAGRNIRPSARVLQREATA